MTYNVFTGTLNPTQSQSIAPTNKPDKLRWTEKDQNAFDNLKAALAAKPILRPPNPEKGYTLYTDGSLIGVSAILMQTGDNDEDEYVVGYASKKLTPAEKKFDIIEIELLAIVFGLIKFHQYIYGTTVEVRTDHRHLVWLNSLNKHSSRLMRWILILQNYDIKVTYIKGEQQIADGLTRTPDV